MTRYYCSTTTATVTPTEISYKILPSQATLASLYCPTTTAANTKTPRSD